MKREWSFVFKLGVGAFLLYLCILYWSDVSHFIAVLFHSAMPLAVGCVIAYLLNMAAVFYQLLRADISFVISEHAE